jgi:predicted nucleic acid-binding protein
VDDTSEHPPVGRLEPAALSVLDHMVALGHDRSRRAPIVGVNAHGVFPSTPGFNTLTLGDRVPPVVPDTNLLSRDVGYAARKKARTVLVNAANSGALRLLCPTHVSAEIVSHAAEFCDQMGISSAAYLATWRRDYLPLMRVIDELGDEMFTPTERERLEKLAKEDLDDVPAAKLAIAAGGFVLSEDARLLDAIYGPHRVLSHDLDGHAKWVHALKGWGNAHGLQQMIESGAILARVAAFGVTGTVRQARAAPKTASAVAVVALAAFVAAYRSADPSRRAAARRGMSRAAAGILDLVAQHHSAAEDLARFAAPQPSQTDMAELSSSERVARACIHRLSREPAAIISAREVSERLPLTVSPRGEARIRSVLRTYDAAFAQPYPGWFQLGRPDAELHP